MERIRIRTQFPSRGERIHFFDILVLEGIRKTIRGYSKDSFEATPSCSKIKSLSRDLQEISLYNTHADFVSLLKEFLNVCLKLTYESTEKVVLIEEYVPANWRHSQVVSIVCWHEMNEEELPGNIHEARARSLIMDEYEEKRTKKTKLLEGRKWRGHLTGKYTHTRKDEDDAGYGERSTSTSDVENDVFRTLFFANEPVYVKSWAAVAEYVDIRSLKKALR